MLMDLFFKFFLYTFSAIFPIVNPIGMASVFYAMTKDNSKKKRSKMAYKVAVNFSGLVIVTLFIGNFILQFFGITLPVIEVSGGLLIANTAWEMINAKEKLTNQEEDEIEQSKKDIIFFPLTMPITAGAGTLAVAMSIAARVGNITSWHSFFLYISSVLAILVVAVCVFVCYKYSDWIFKKLGHTGTIIVSKIAAFILLAIGIDIIAHGLKGIIHKYY
jgi:multiple antibiotic resistance protein